MRPAASRSGRPTRSRSHIKTKKNKIGTQLWGPSGAPIWSSPSIDVKRNALYATTGDNYSDPTSRLSDALLAFDLDTGKILWSRQMTASDAYTAGCRIPDKTNCPDSNGPDFDSAPGRFSSHWRTANARWWRDKSRGWSMRSIPTIKAS